MKPKTRLFLILWLAGMAGVLSFLMVDLPALVAFFPQPEGSAPVELPPPVLLKLVSILQPAILTSLAVLLGVFLAPKVGLHSPAAEALASRDAFWPTLRPQVVPGLIAGAAAGAALVLTWVIMKPYLPELFVTRGQEFNKFIPAAVRILYGGFTEELLLRWGVMTLLVWVLWRVFQRDDQVARAIYVVPAVVVAAVVFGIGHLPIAALLAGGLTSSIVVYVVTVNTLFGVVAGLLYWRVGLEAAMLAHMSAHFVLIAAIGLAL